LNPKFFQDYLDYCQPQNYKGGKVGGARAGGEVAAYEFGLIVGDLIMDMIPKATSPASHRFCPSQLYQ
jgi:hypothetical protein